MCQMCAFVEVIWVGDEGAIFIEKGHNFIFFLKQTFLMECVLRVVT